MNWAGAFHEGVGAVGEELLVAGEGVVFPGVEGHPCGAHGPETLRAIAGGGAEEDIGDMVRGPSGGTVLPLGGVGALHGEVVHEVEEG